MTTKVDLEQQVRGTSDDITEGSVNLFLSVSDQTKLDNVPADTNTSKQDTLVSGVNIKTINSTSLLGSGDITINGDGHTIKDEGTPLTQRTNLNFVGAGVVVTDTAGSDETTVTITGVSECSVTASGNLTADKIIIGSNGLAEVKTSDKGIVTILGTDDTTLPTSKAVKDVTDTKVTGPASSTDNALARFDSTTGKLIQNGIVTEDDNGNLNSVTGISLDITPTNNPTTEGSLYRNAEEDTLDIVQSGTTLQVGQETQYNIKGDEVTGIPDGKVVMFTGTNGISGNLKGALAVSDGTYSPKLLMGISSQAITYEGEGKVTRFGKVRGIQTDGANYSETWLEGDLLYPNPTVAGGLTNIMPTSPNWKNSVAVVINVHASNGTIFVRAENIPEIGELNDVDTTGETTGDLLIRNGTHRINNPVFKDTKTLTGFTDNLNITVAGNSTNRTVTLTHGTAVVYYWRGQKISLGASWTSSAHGSDTAKVYYLYSTDGLTFAWSETLWSFADIQVATTFYDVANSKWVYLREIHGTYDYESHLIDHNNIGTFRYSGGIPTSGTYALNSSVDANLTPGFDQALIYDEDLPSTITAWTQGTYTTAYIGGSSVMTFGTTDSFPYKFTVAGYINYNNATAGTLVQGATGKFYNVYQILIPMASDTDSQKFRTIFLQPQNTYNTLALAQAEDFRSLNLGTLANLSPEFVGFTRLTYGSNASYGTTGKVQLNGLTYLSGSRASQVIVGGFTPTNHSALSNLSWDTSGHTGTNSSVASFDGSGVATNTLLSTIVQTTGTQSITDTKTFDKDKLAMKGTSTGVTTFSTTNTSATNYTQSFQSKTGTVANMSDTMYIGTTGVTLNRASAALTLAGITLTTPDIGTPTSGILTNCTGLPAAGVVNTAATLTDTQTLTNKRITKRVVTTTQSATPTINTDNGDVFTITGLAQAITSFTSGLTGTPTAEQTMIINITDNGTARAITWGTSFESSKVALPTTTVISTLLKVGFIWNTVTSKWRCVAVA